MGLDAQRHISCPDLRLARRRDLLYKRSRRDRLNAERLLLQQSAHSVDDRRRPLIVSPDICQDFPDLAEIGWVRFMTEDYILTARAKGLDENQVLYKHGLKNAMLPMVTIIAMTFGFLIDGATLTETVFTWRGMGQYIFHTLLRSDYPVIQAIFMIIAITAVLANFIADLLYGVLDPRIKYG